MKKSVFLFTLLIALSSMTFADGFENFANYPETGNSYQDGTFTGQDGSTWEYWQCRGDQIITDETPCLGKNRTPTSEVTSGNISGGLRTFNFDYMQAFSTNVNLEVYVNSILVATVISSGEQGIVKNSGDITVAVPGDFVFTFIQANNSSGQVSIDNISYTSFGGGNPDPEPTNYPTNFVATACALTIDLTWTDAIGEQLPSAYLIKASIEDNITAPVDGTPVSDDTDLSDGEGAKNINYGEEFYSFTGLASATIYYFKIYPYTNSGTEIDYKTDGTAPSANTNTDVVLEHEGFDDGLGDWTPYSVTGDQEWYQDEYGGKTFAKISGYDGQAFENEDWLISPPLNLDEYNNEILSFETAMNYDGPELEVKISTDYSGSGDPNIASWTTLPASFSPGGWEWTFSGNIDISTYQGTQVYISFLYNSTDLEAATWELDDILVTADTGVGINDNSEKNIDFHLYPNPANSVFYIENPDVCFSVLKIYSSSGKIVYQENLNNGLNKIELFNIDTGIYFVKIIDSNTNKFISKKLIIMK